VQRDPILPSLGSTVAYGEVDFLVHKIIERKEIHLEKIEKSKTDVNFLISKAYEVGHESTILLSYKLYSSLYTEIYRRNLHNQTAKRIPMKLDNHNLLFLNNKELEDKIIIFDKFSILLSYVPSFNFVTEKPEPLHIEIGIMEKEGKTDVQVRSLIKLNFLDISKINIFQIEE
jgi:hypothetical protein